MYYLAAKRCCDNNDVKLGELLSSPPHSAGRGVYIGKYFPCFEEGGITADVI
jgi:hypothetical protein